MLSRLRPSTRVRTARPHRAGSVRRLRPRWPPAGVCCVLRAAGACTSAPASRTIQEGGGGCTRRGSQNAATGTAARCPRCRLGMLRHQRGACGGANAGRSTQVITRNAAKHLWSRGMASEPVSCPSAPGLDAVPPGTLIVVLCTHRAVAGHAVWTCRACWLQCRAPYAAA